MTTTERRPALSVFCLDKWSLYSPPPSKYTLGFIRTADEQTAKVALREAILIGLANNPGIVVDRSEIPKAAATVLQEQAIFDPSLNLDFNQDFVNDPSGRRQTESFSVTTPGWISRPVLISSGFPDRGCG